MNNENDTVNPGPAPVLATGCLPTPMDVRLSSGIRQGYTGTMVPKGEWRSTQALKPFVPRGRCQKHVPSCNWHTTGKAYQTKYAFMTGGRFMPNVSYVAGFQEDTGGNFDTGTLPINSIKAIATKGMHPVGPECPEWFDRPRKIPASVEAERFKYRADEWEEIRTLEELMSAILNNDPVNAGIHWYNADANPGPTGHLKHRPPGQHGGHSVLFFGALMNYQYSPMGIGIVFNNHHGDSKTPGGKNEFGQEMKFPSWGDDGFGVVPVERLIEGMPLYGAWALRTVYIQNEHLNDVPQPKFE